MAIGILKDKKEYGQQIKITIVKYIKDFCKFAKSIDLEKCKEM